MVQAMDICSARKKLGLSQEQLAEALGVSRNTISREAENTLPKHSCRRILCTEVLCMERSKFKRLISLFLSVSLLLGLLGACKSVSSPDPSAPPENAPEAEELIELVLPYSGCEDPEAVERLNAGAEELDTYIEKAYALTVWADGAIIRATGASAFELAAIRLEDEDAAKAGEALLKDYLHSREGDFTGYAPEQADMVSKGVIVRHGTWLGLFICPDPEGTRAAFEAALKGKALPQQPAPVPTPEAELNMQSLMVDLIGFCKEEIDAVKIPIRDIDRYTSAGFNYGGFNTNDSNQERADSPFLESMTTYYSMDAEQIESGFNVMIDVSSWLYPETAFEITVLRMTSEEAAVQSVDVFQQYRKNLEAIFTEKGLPSEAELAANGLVVQTGRYLALFISQDPKAVKAEFEDALIRLSPPQTSQSSESPPKVDMELLGDRLWAFSQDERDGLEKEGCSVRRSTRSQDISRGLWQINFDRVESCLYMDGVYSAERAAEGTSAFCLCVLYMEDEASAIQAMNAFRLYLWSQAYINIEAFNGTHERTERLNNGLITHLGRYAVMVVSQDQEAMLAEIEAALRELPPESASEPPAPSRQPQAPSGEPAILDGIDWPEPEGEPDPNHPGRIKFVQPNEEDMSVYDTSAILTAWKKDDPADLSEYDRAIYDAAQAVLEEIIRDGMSDLEKETAVYDWVTRNIVYGWSRMDVLEETPREAYTPYGGLVDRMATCLGYAASFQLLMDMAGVECITVVGATLGSTGDHAWNMVRLDGEWYCVDATWDFHYWENTPPGWRFFNVTSDFMARTNHQWDYGNIPEATAEGHGRG